MGSPKPGSKYAALYRYLLRQGRPRVEVGFTEVESLIGAPLPPSARHGRGFWSNRRGGLQAAAWLEAGYRVREVDLRSGRVVFGRRGWAGVGCRARHRWDGDLVRALREHLDLNQAELAEVLGVRQQTVSEWEGGVYLPSRSRSRHLDLVAERAAFRYETRSDEDPPRGG